MDCANGCGRPAKPHKPRPQGGGCAPIYCGDVCREQAKAKRLATNPERKAHKAELQSRRRSEAIARKPYRPCAPCANGCGRLAEAKPERGSNTPKYCGNECRKEVAAKRKAKYNTKPENKRRQAIRSKRYRMSPKGMSWEVKVHNREYEAERAKTPRAKRQKKAANARYRAKPEAKQRASLYQATVGKAKSLSATHRRRARKRGALSDGHTRQEVWDRDCGFCQICHRPVDPNDWHEDHIIPLGHGDDMLDNVRVTHPKCNQEKIAEDKRMLAKWREPHLL